MCRIELVLLTAFVLVVVSRDRSNADGSASRTDLRPNILLIVTDDQAPWAVGHTVKSGRFSDVPAANTPNMDRLAKEVGFPPLTDPGL